MVSQIQVVDPNNIVPRADRTDIDSPYYTKVGPGRSTSDPATPRQLEYIKERLDSGTLPINLEQGAKRFLDTSKGQPLKSYTSDFVGALKKHEAELKDRGLDQDAPSSPDLSKFKTVDKQVNLLEVGDLVPKTFITSKGAQSAVAEERKKDPKFELPPLE
jgi:hypothetical protein